MDSQTATNSSAVPGFAFEGLRYGFSTVDQGNLSFRWGEAEEVARNRAAFFQSFGIDPAHAVTAQLEHGSRVVCVSGADAGRGVLTDDYVLTADSLITNEPGLYLFHVVADCAAVLFFDTTHHAVGLAHCGWRGADLNITAATVAALQQSFSTNPTALTVGIGPSIRPCCYVYPRAELTTKDSLRWVPYLEDVGGGRARIDVIRFLVDELVAAGVPRDSICVNEICTGHDDRFFSHYHARKRNQPEARFGALIGLQV